MKAKTCKTCGGVLYARGFCRRHYTRWYRRTPNGRLVIQRYVKSAKCKAKNDRYKKSEKGRAVNKVHCKRFRDSENGKAVKRLGSRAYYYSDCGYEYYRQYRAMKGHCV